MRPDDLVGTAGARCALVAAHSAAHVEVKLRREVLRFGVGGEVRDPEVGLSVRLHRLVEGGAEGKPLAVRAKGEFTRAHVDGEHLLCVTAVHAYRVKLS